MIVVTGDVNFDLLCARDSLVSRYTSILDMFGLEQMATKPTGVTGTTKTLIDHIITNFSSRIATTDVIPTGIVSDLRA